MNKLLEVNSIEQAIDYLALEFFVSSVRKGLSPKQAFASKGLTFPTLVPDDWKSFDLEGHCRTVLINDVLICSQKKETAGGDDE